MAHVTAIHEEILLRFAGSVLGFDDKTMNGHQVRIGRYIHKGGCIDIAFGVAEDGLDTLFLRTGRQFEQDLVVMHEGETHFRIDENDVVELSQQIS